MPDWLSILPPLLAIVVAIWKKEVVLALALGIWMSESLIVGRTMTGVESAFVAIPESMGQGFIEMIDRLVSVFEDGGNTRVLLFCLLVGMLIELMQVSGGVTAFVKRMTQMGMADTQRRAGLLTMAIGVLVWMETSMSCLAAGMVGRPLFDRFKLSRARLAYVLDSTCAPVSVIILLNAWGGYILELLEKGEYGFEEPVNVVMSSIGFNFYAILTLGLVAYTAISGRTHGALRRVEAEESEAETPDEPSKALPDHVKGKAGHMLIPLVIMVALMVLFLMRTGSGSRSVLYSVTVATVIGVLLLIRDRVFTYREIIEHGYRGMGKLLPVVLLMLLAFAIGASCRELGTGSFVAGWVGSFLPLWLVAPLLFICAGIISFTTGTSWGTFAILIPVGMPLGAAFGLPPGFVLAAVLGGGVFGDHCSPISDTTLVASLASGCDHLEHVRTQLPYAMTAGLGTILLYMAMGLFL
ncbi:Na-H-antiporter domain-containing protein [Sulfidibacter corallicola]|uniref:Na+/H+ antiporter NhaC-like C-terminal domain-containing protein n=1 Tax=Sulfidibacter corallicola TaxID=2818388 RepID=A0A8A4TUU5_SULCO|nr:Na+/H+ antiporter NhaC family protein [Sulfidibacter corallicola]QTD52904.1 hypothetical protein J3U87_10540 [Sulfidibacter corallicola]